MTQRTAITIKVESEPIAVMLDVGVVAKRAAEMLAQRIREQTEQIAEQVKPGTAQQRRRLEKAFAAGKGYAVRQFTGGRTGVTPPRAGSNQAFNHSGRLASSIVAAFVKSAKEWKINFAANRWNPRDWRDLGAMQQAFQQWVARVPVLRDASADIGVQRAVRETFAEVVEKGRMNEGYRAAKLRLESWVKAAQFVAQAVAA